MPDGTLKLQETKLHTCKECQSTSNDVGFYDSVYNRCKECHKTYVKKVRKENSQHYKDFDRSRAWNPDRVAARKAYAEEMRKNPDFRLRQQAQKNAWADRNQVKRRAHMIAGNAIRDKKLSRPKNCERCDLVVRTEAHHENYYKPLDVVWLCEACHGIRHREINEEIRNGVNWSIKGF